MTTHAVEFGWVIQPAALQWAERESLLEHNRQFFERVRHHFQSAWFEDHFQDVGRYQHHQRLEGWVNLCYHMALYPELRFGHLVLGQSYRNPALVAKMAATAQAVSQGRFILGVGAGWHAPEYRAYGWHFPTPGVRTRQLDEYVRILKLMLTQSPASFTGKYYAIAEAYNDPLPNPPLPLMIGGSGERGTLRTTAKYANWWNFGLRPPDEFQHKLDVLKRHCDEVGRDFNEITPTTFQFVSLANDPTHYVTIGDMRIITGDADAVTRQLEAYVALGARHFMLRFVDFPSVAGLELFISKVLPRFR
jgi:alkanesulfonate monooxygenase SsuD/methylene tetrahydromethanopterin reductase-like flavin-dependent oxidoreductase (luciferase family)